MTITVTPLNPSGHALGARITGVDLRAGIDAATHEEIERALDIHAVLGFPGEPLDDEQQLRFSRGFGPLHQASRDASKRRLKDPNFQDVSNLTVENAIALNGERGYSDANLLWHTDLSFVKQRARVTILSSRELPPDPPDTQFADMRAAWDALPDVFEGVSKRELQDLVVEHDILVSRRKTGFTMFTEEEKRLLPPVQHPLVTTHARTGRKSLYLASHASHVIGWPHERGECLLAALIEFATQPQFVFSYRWTLGDVLVWDDSCTMHRATPFDNKTYRRELRWNSAVQAA